MSIKIITGNIFTSKCKTIVNTVNCVGVMGAGIALEYKLRYPEMFSIYKNLCSDKKIDIGLLWLYKSKNKWILNFPTKKHWKYPSKKEYLQKGLEKFVESYKHKKIESIAFPLLGADRGGIEPDMSLMLMEQFLKNTDVDIEIYKYDPKAKDDLYDETKTWILSNEVHEIAKLTGLRKVYIEKVVEAMYSSNIVQLNQLLKIKGIGLKTVETIFKVANENSHVKKQPKQLSFFI